MSKPNKNRPYELLEYNPEWKMWFQVRSEKIKPLFGDNLISIEHIGSTSIERMIAKPNIDILVVVKDLDDVTKRLESFTNEGYTPQGREYVGGGDEYITEDTSDGRRITSIHVLQEGNPKITAYREFRDYLRVHEQEKNLYIETKKKIYVENTTNYSGYDSGKAETIKAIKMRAHEWSKINLPELA